MSREDFAAFVEARRVALGLDKSELARRAGLSRQALYKVLSGDVQEARLSTIIGLGSALACSPLTLMQALFGGAGVVVDGARPPKRGKGGVAAPDGEGKYPGDASRFIADVTVPDNSLIMIGSEFVKQWKILNAGGVAWEGRRLRCVDELLRLERVARGDAPAAFDDPQPTGLVPLAWEAPIPPTRPGEEALLSVTFRAPLVPGSYVSHWKMVDAEGDFCFPRLQGLSCVVKVVGM